MDHFCFSLSFLELDSGESIVVADFISSLFLLSNGQVSKVINLFIFEISLYIFILFIEVIEILTLLYIYETNFSIYLKIK